MEKIPLISIKKSDFLNSPLYNGILSYVFYSGKLAFADIVSDGTIRYFFGNENKLFVNPNQFKFSIERVYLEVDTLDVYLVVASFTDIESYTSSLMLIKSRGRFEIKCVYEDLESIDYKKHVVNALPTNINKDIVGVIKNTSWLKLESLLDNPYYKDLEIIYNISRFNDDFIELATALIKTKFKTNDRFEIESIGLDLSNFDNPSISRFKFISNSKSYEYLLSGELIENSNMPDGETKKIYIEPFLIIATNSFIRDYQFIYEQERRTKNKEECEKILYSLYSKRFTIKKDKYEYAFIELGEDPFIFFEDEILIYETRNSNYDVCTSLSYEDVLKEKSILKDAIDKYINTKPEEYDLFIKQADDLFNEESTIEELIKVSKEIVKTIDSLAPYDKNQKENRELINRINDKILEIESLDKKKISKALGLIRKIVDINTYNELCDDLFDVIDEMSDVELLAIKKEYDEFLDRFRNASNYTQSQSVYRRVFIRKSALETLIEYDKNETNLKIVEITDQIVDNLKTIPGKDLGRYLVSKGMNCPYKKDPSIRKIRIMNKAKYRLLFVFGSDLGSERCDNSAAIYIFGVTKHDKDKGELYNLCEHRPREYEINDFIVYPTNKNVNIPECTKEQYEIASTDDNRPTITFGCAGSGKTTVSIEQYVSIVYNQYDSISPSSDELVYVTYHRRLSENASTILKEYKINANSFYLCKYFAHVLGIEDYETKLRKLVERRDKKELTDDEYKKEAAKLRKEINEQTFINWYRQTYSPDALKKNKYGIKDKIAPIKDKQDVERLIYTYYRGVFKGSRAIYYSNKDYLDLDEFLEAMGEEEYLTKIEKETIYKVCFDFNNYVKENNLYSDNDYAIEVIRQSNYKINKTKRIIIDEVQDFTEIEIIATILSLEDDCNYIYYFGDPHQSINPNLFKHETINRIYYDLKKVEPNDSTPLDVTYRTNVNLIKYLNKLLKYREEWIALTDGGIVRIRMPNEQEELMEEDIVLNDEEAIENITWAGYVTNPKLYNKIFEVNPKSIVIAPSESIKNEVLKKYPFLQGRVISIYEAKGMEYETVIMYNMFTDYYDYFMDMVTKNGKSRRSTIHRMTFNKYYVGCTRATRNFIIIEENLDIFDKDNPIYQKLLSTFGPIYKDEQIERYILGENTFEGWYYEALQNLDNDNMEMFEKAVYYAGLLAKTKEQKKKLEELMGNDVQTLEALGISFLKQGKYDIARGAFIKCNRLSNRHGAYIILAVLLLNKEPVKNIKHLEELMRRTDLLVEYPEVIPLILKDPLFVKKMKDIYTKMFKKGK